MTMEEKWANRSNYNILIAVRGAVWYQRLCGYYTYDHACDVFEILLKVRDNA